MDKNCITKGKKLIHIFLLFQKEELNCSAVQNFSQVLFIKEKEVTVLYYKLDKEIKIGL